MRTIHRLILSDPSLLKGKCYVAGEWIGGAAASAVINRVDDSVVQLGAEALPTKGAPCP